MLGPWTLHRSFFASTYFFGGTVCAIAIAFYFYKTRMFTLTNSISKWINNSWHLLCHHFLISCVGSECLWNVYGWFEYDSVTLTPVLSHSNFDLNYYYYDRLWCHRLAALPHAYRAHAKRPVLCTHWGFKKGILTVSWHYPTPVCIE